MIWYCQKFYFPQISSFYPALLLAYKERRRERERKQGRIHGKTVADGWAGAVIQKTLAIQKCDGWTDGRTDRQTDRRTDRPTRQGVELRVRD